MYRNTHNTLPEWVASVGYLKDFSSSHVNFGAIFMSISPKSIAGLQYFHSYIGENKCKECDTTHGFLRMDVACHGGQNDT